MNVGTEMFLEVHGRQKLMVQTDWRLALLLLPLLMMMMKHMLANK